MGRRRARRAGRRFRLTPRLTLPRCARARSRCAPLRPSPRSLRRAPALAPLALSRAGPALTPSLGRSPLRRKILGRRQRRTAPRCGPAQDSRLAARAGFLRLKFLHLKRVRGAGRWWKWTGSRLRRRSRPRGERRRRRATGAGAYAVLFCSLGSTLPIRSHAASPAGRAPLRGRLRRRPLFAVCNGRPRLLQRRGGGRRRTRSGGGEVERGDKPALARTHRVRLSPPAPAPTPPVSSAREGVRRRWQRSVVVEVKMQTEVSFRSGDELL